MSDIWGAVLGGVAAVAVIVGIRILIAWLRRWE